MRIGLTLGKFMPLHLGHEHLIQTGLDNCDIINVVVCSLSTEPIDGKLRFEWVKNRFADEIESGKMKVFHMDDDDMPQVPEDCIDSHEFYSIWRDEMERICSVSVFDVFFSSELYVYPMAEYLNCEPFLVDLERKTFPVSGTKVRENPFAMWDFINEDVRKYFTKKILIIGGESTGKSTMTRALENYYSYEEGYDAIGVQEFARGWIDKFLDGDMNKLEYDHITKFGVFQMKLVESYLGKHQIVISDTDAIVSSTFQKKYFNEVSLNLALIAEKEQWDLALLLYPDLDWEDDGQRDFGKAEERMWFFNEHKGWLERLGIPYVVIKGYGGHRFNAAIQAVNQVLYSIDSVIE